VSREVTDKVRWVECPGCGQAASGEYYGQVLITLADTDSRDALLARIANVESRALATQPERRIVSRNWDGDTLEVLTTSQKLAHRIAHEVEKVFGGKAHFSWSDGDGALRATLKTRVTPGAKPRSGRTTARTGTTKPARRRT
jgi:hypothetical protein